MLNAKDIVMPPFVRQPYTLAELKRLTPGDIVFAHGVLRLVGDEGVVRKRSGFAVSLKPDPWERPTHAHEFARPEDLEGRRPPRDSGRRRSPTVSKRKSK